MSVTIYEPTAVAIQQNRKIVFLTACADEAAPKIATEIKAATSVEGTLALTSWNPSVNVNTGSAKPRVGTGEQLPRQGNKQYQPIGITYPHDPSKDDTDDNNQLRALLKENTTVFAVVRDGTDIETDWTVADLGQTYQVKCGFQDTNGDNTAGGTTDEFAEFEISQQLFLLKPPTACVLGT